MLFQFLVDFVQKFMTEEFNFLDYDWENRTKIGSGSFGVVYKVISKKNNEEVAIKQMDMSVIKRDPFLLEALQNEVKVMKEMKGEHFVIQLHDAHFGKKYAYLIMDLCDSDLRKKMDKGGGKMVEVEAIYAMTQIMKGIKAIVDRGYIHRDLKPENTLIKGNTYKISDLGFITKADIKGMKKLEDCCGTPLYMAPQLLAQKPYTAKSDIWSLGIILFEMIFGYAPWPCRSLETYKNNILYKPLAFPYNAKIGENTKDFIKRCLVVDEAKRITWDQIFKHPLIKDKEVGEQAETVNLPEEIVDILRKMQDKAKKLNIDMLEVLDMTSKEHEEKFNEVCENVDPGISEIEKRMLFFALDKQNEGALEGKELKKILVENDFRDVDDISSRLEAELIEVIKLKKLDVKELFRGFDKNKTGSVDFFEFKSMLKQLMPGLTDDNFRKMWDKFDRNKSGDISLTQFMSAIEIASTQHASYQKNLKKEKAKRGVQSLKKAISLYKISLNDLMKHFDKDKDGRIDCSEFGRMVVCVDKYVRDEELKQMFQLLDEDASGYVSVSELKNFLGVK